MSRAAPAKGLREHQTVNPILGYLMDAVAIAFVLLGIVTAAGWLRRRDPSLGFLALAIILLAAVVGEGRLQAHLPFTVPLLAQLSLAGFAGSAYALLRYRDSLIPLPRRWHVAAAASLAAASVTLIAAQALTANRSAVLAIAVAWLLVWCLCIGEPIVRFWLVARRLPAVQGWRLRSLSLGFGGLVLVLLLAISIGVFIRQVAVQVAIEDVATSVIKLPVRGLTAPGTLVIGAGRFTPAFGTDEMTRAQQILSAFVTAIDRRHLIVQLEQSNSALQEANRHKSVFLANMSHELRTPLNAIIGFSELLTDASDGQFDAPTRTRFLNQILTSGKHLLGLINDILDLSKVEAGQMELRLQVVSVAEVVDQVVKTVEPLVAKKNIQLQADVKGSGEL